MTAYSEKLRTSFVDALKRPFGTGCKAIIDKGRHFCHVPASSWGEDVKQAQVCELCSDHNAKLLTLCSICGVTQITTERWDAGSRICGQCFELELMRRKPRLKNKERFTILVSKRKLAEPRIKIGFAAAAIDLGYDSALAKETRRKA